MLPLGIGAIYYLASFFSGDVNLSNKVEKSASVQRTGAVIPDKASGPSSVLPGMAKAAAFSGPPAVGCVLEVAAESRPRLAGMMTNATGNPAGIIQFHGSAVKSSRACRCRNL